MDRFTLFPPIFYNSQPLATTTTTTTTTSSPIIRQNFTKPNNFVLITSANNNATIDKQLPKFTAEGWSIALIVLTTVRLIIVLSLWIYLTRRIINSKVPLSRVWHSQLLLASIAISHLILYAFVFPPSNFSCSVIRLGVGLAYAIPFALLTLKLILIASNYRGYDLPQIYQALLLSLLIGVQIALSAQWLTLVPTNNVIKVDTCGISVAEWLRHLIYVILLMLSGTVMSIATRHIKSNHRDSMFLGLALGLNIPVWMIWSCVGTLIKTRYSNGFDDRCIAFGLFITTSIVLFVMFIPRSRQLVVVGVNGMYSEDSTPVSKPISELTVHKLYYPVYADRRVSTTANGQVNIAESACESNSGLQFRMSNHWYPPLSDSARQFKGSKYHFDDVVSVHHHHQHQVDSRQQQLQRRQLGQLSHQSYNGHAMHAGVRCLTPPSEEEGSTTSSINRKTEKTVAEDDDEDTDLDMDIGKYHERNVDSEIVSYSQVVAQQQPMY
ncbi:hypothetical protein CHUAL_009168 [Chamberlinius hualienensis]